MRSEEIKNQLLEIKSGRLSRKVEAVPTTPRHTHEELIKSGYTHKLGKVRDLYLKDDHLILFHSDRLTAFDRKISEVPYRGIILCHLAQYWQKACSAIVPTQEIEPIDERTYRVNFAKPFAVEVIVRNYLAGSMLRAYESGRRDFCGVTLPENLEPYSKLPEPLLTPTTKAEVFEHDEEISAEDIVAKGICSQSEWKQISENALAVFRLGEKKFQSIGWTLADTKYEFGCDSEGNVVLIDECHTPDSSRLWKFVPSAPRPLMFDKEIVRTWLLEQGFSGEGEVPKVPDEVLVELGLKYLEVAASLIDS